MDRRGFLAAAGLGMLGAWMPGVMAFPMGPSPVWGRSFDDLHGTAVSFSHYLGQPVIMNFWASWCAPCVREMPLLESLHHDHPGLKVLGIAIDTGPNIARFLQKVSVSYDLYLGGTQGIPLMRELGNKTGGLPFTVFFDRRGRAVDSVMGELKSDTIAARLQRIL